MRLDVCGKRTYEYVFESISLLNRGLPVTLRGIGGNINKVMEIASILEQIGVEPTNIKLYPFKVCKFNTFSCEMDLISESKENDERITDYSQLGYAGLRNESNGEDYIYIDFPIYHLLFDRFLSGLLEITVAARGGEKLLKINEDRSGNLTFTIQAHQRDEVEQTFAALYRSGVLMPTNWKEIAYELSRNSDVILGVDTNIIYNCSISEHLLPAISLIEPHEYIQTPNWMLITIPNSAMHEVEESANIRDNVGKLDHSGRMGFRALQEIIELNLCSDIAGVSVLITGDANPVLDTRVELQGLRQDLRRLQANLQVSKEFFSKKTSSGDMIIRDQFKNFLRQMNFHKGTYFLTADKSNSALAKAEGLKPVYFDQPEYYYDGIYHALSIDKLLASNPACQEYVVRECEDFKDEPNQIKIVIPIGKIIYEMATEFGNIEISNGLKSIKIHCEELGKNLDYWFSRKLMIGGSDLNFLLKEYKGVFPLSKALNLWININENVTDLV